MIRSTPMINTARLTLCAMRPEDFDRFAEIWRDPCVVQHVGGSPRSRGEAWDSFLRNAGHWHMAGFGQWGVLQQSNRKLIGQAGFFYGNRQMGDDFDGFPEAQEWGGALAFFYDPDGNVLTLVEYPKD